jgi:hypothetical protein
MTDLDPAGIEAARSYTTQSLGDGDQTDALPAIRAWTGGHARQLDRGEGSGARMAILRKGATSATMTACDAGQRVRRLPRPNSTSPSMRPMRPAAPGATSWGQQVGRNAGGL